MITKTSLNVFQKDKNNMKLSVAVALLVSTTSTVVAFQAPSSAFSTSRQLNRRNVLAIDPTTGAVPVTPSVQEEEQSRPEFDMTGIAFSVRGCSICP